MNIAKCFIYSVLFCIAIEFIYSQSSYTFLHLGPKDGLSQTAINDIYQDESGMMWFATRGGLDRYDGNRIKVYHPVLQDSSYFPVLSKIDAIYGDNNGHLFLRAHGKFILFDMRKETFNSIIKDGVSASGEGKRGIWLGIENKIYLLNKQTRKIEFIHVLDEIDKVSSIYEDSKGTCWIGTANQLFSLDKNKTLKRYFSDRAVSKMVEDRYGNLWMVSTKGLIKFQQDGLLKIFTHDPKDPESLVHDNVRAICIDLEDFLWIGSQHGLCRMNPETEKFETFQPVFGREFGLNSKSVMSLFADKQGAVWIGSFFKGVNYLNISKQPFRFYYERGGIPFPVVGKILEDKRGIIWICTEGGGLCSMNPENDSFESYNQSKNGLVDLNYIAIYYDKERDCLWLLSISSNITRFNLKSKRAVIYDKPDNGLFKNSIDFIPYKGKLLLGTRYGLAEFDTNTGEVKAFLDEDTHLKLGVNSLLMDSNNQLWMATVQKGVKCYNFTDKTITSFEHSYNSPSGLASNEINVVFEDSKKRIWIGTKGSGLNLYRPESNDFELFTKESNGLIDNNIVALNESKSGQLLIGTPQGFSTLNVEKRVFRNYDYTQGFPLVGVNDRSIFVSSSGRIFVGGVDGMTIFSEDDLRSVPLQPFDVQFSRIFVNNVEVVQGDKTGILKNTLPFTDKVDLKHQHSVFSVEFITDNYVRSQFGEIEYRLKEFETNWIPARFGRMLTYTNLSPGKYVLEVRPKAFPDRVRSLTIKIHPPIYFTWPAFLLYVALISAIIYWLVRQARIHFFLKTSLEFEHNEKVLNEELIQSKLRFFTNISHEFRTPITLIMGQAETLLRSYNIPPMVYSKILNIYKNANNLKGLINELLDFRKQEQGHLHLKITCVELISFLEEIYLTFKEYALNRGVDFQFKYVETEIFVWIDPDQMQKVVNNLLSNAFKYTPSGGTICISVRDWEEDVEFAITDNGSGISQDAIEHVFDRFYQANTVESTVGTGIGLALSKGIVDAHKGKIKVESSLGKGSVFIVRLKKGDKHFEDNVLRLDINAKLPYQNEVLKTDEFIQEMKQMQGELNKNLPAILIVEDHEELRNMLVESFSYLYHVEVASDGQEGWEKVKKLNPDIVISDIMMPKMSGIELCSKIKNSFETCHIPIILLTAKTAIEHKFEGLRTGADDYVTKPFDVKLLIIRCNNLINNRKMLHQKFINNAGFFSPQIATNVPDQDLLDKATDIVLAQLQDDKFDVDMFAQEMNLGRTTFFNKLKAITGLTPNQFIMNIRLKKAAELLTGHQEMNISDVAYSVGFTSPYYFSRCFKELFGVTPGEYKKGEKGKKEE